ncbi:glycoside hydrolase family 15 protein [Haloechinothrix halophila]|uniref:glycoside hydrolase family 15 protein n=1 Tax=Haloechinothrix halophila TaxID=1069073 RepID=UPI000685BF12|nr:glycoside hydrolase family 15 protein [Haloechinothrix halophila]
MSTPIADYGVLSDCGTAALVDRHGSVDWLCLPRFDSPSVFTRLLDPDGGHWAISPTDTTVTVRRRYMPGTLVLETTFDTASGSARLRDALLVPHGQRGDDLGRDAPHELVREVEGISGTVDFAMELVPRPEYGLVRPLLRVVEGGARTFGGPNQFAMRAPVPLHGERDRADARFRVAAGQRRGFSLVWGPPERPPPEPTAPERVGQRIDDTAAAWRSWEAEHDIYQGPHHELVRFSSRVLKGLSYKPTGAIVAAPTTSLPEKIGGERNWDYRYAWIRDASLTMEALYTGACPDEAVDFVSFMTSAAGGSARDESSLQIMYGITGEHDLSERELPHLRGWRDSRPVRIGNGAWCQIQVDVYGELLNALYLYRQRLGTLHPEIQHFATDLAETAVRRWREPDAGMWESRGEPRHHLSSKLLCWVALDRAVRLAPDLGNPSRAAVWATERDRIRDVILEQGWSTTRQAYTQAFDSDELDASVLLMPIYGFVPATDERMRATIDAIARDLTENGLVLRYRAHDGRNTDGLVGEEGTFVLASCWLVSALAQAGELARAERLFDRLCAATSDLGLLSEEIDPRTGELLGNYPQAFSHIGLINAAADIDQARTARSTRRVRPHGGRTAP